MKPDLTAPGISIVSNVSNAGAGEGLPTIRMRATTLRDEPVPCDDALKKLLEELERKLSSRPGSYVELLPKLASDIQVVKRDLRPRGRAWTIFDEMEQTVLDALRRADRNRRDQMPPETVTDLGIHLDLSVFAIGTLSDTRLGQTQRTREDFQLGGRFAITKDVFRFNQTFADKDHTTLFVGGQGVFYATDNTQLVNIGGALSPIGQGNSVKAGGFIGGFRYHPIDEIMLRTYGGIGFASNNYQISQFGSTVASNTWFAPAFMAGVGLYYSYCSCFYIGATADYMYQPEDTVFLNNGTPLVRGGQGTWLFGASLIIPLAVLTAAASAN